MVFLKKQLPVSNGSYTLVVSICVTSMIQNIFASFIYRITSTSSYLTSWRTYLGKGSFYYRVNIWHMSEKGFNSNHEINEIWSSFYNANLANPNVYSEETFCAFLKIICVLIIYGIYYCFRKTRKRSSNLPYSSTKISGWDS